MPNARSRARLWSFAACALPLPLALAVVCASFQTEAETTQFFRSHRYHHPVLRESLGLVSDWGNAMLYPVYLAFLVRGRRLGQRSLTRLALTYLAVQLVVGFALVRFIKITTGLPRPGIEGPPQLLTMNPGYHSLPSGHTTEIAGASTPLALRWGPLPGLGLGLFMALEGFSRIYLGQHHPIDVFFGWLLGLLAGLTIHALAREDHENP